MESVLSEKAMEKVRNERARGRRRIFRCGYDVIADIFFVEEEKFNWHTKRWERQDRRTFVDYFSYSNYLNGNVFDHACYYQLNPDRLPLDMPLERFFERECFIEYTIDSISPYPTQAEQKQYDKIEKHKPLIEKWLNKFRSCTTYQQLVRTIQNYQKSVLYREWGISHMFFLRDFFCCDFGNPDHDQIIIEYILNERCAWPDILAVCLICDPKLVIETCRKRSKEKRVDSKRLHEIQVMACHVIRNEVVTRVQSYFDEKTHYYCIETIGKIRGSFGSSPVLFTIHCENLCQLVERLHGDLRFCDLSGVQNAEYDFSSCITDDTTLLPIYGQDDCQYAVHKGFERGQFFVLQEWRRKDGIRAKICKHVFDYFCDFVAFLKGDLSDATLLACNGLKNVTDFSRITLSGAEIPYAVAQIAGQVGAEFYIDKALLPVPMGTEANEEETALALQTERDSEILIPFVSDVYRVYYISDLHLLHKIQSAKAKMETNVRETIYRIAKEFSEKIKHGTICVMDGDISSDFRIYKMLIEMIKRSTEHTESYIFTLGNHEFWGFPGYTIAEIVERYRNLLTENGMHLLHNNILFKDSYDEWQSIETEDLLTISREDLRAKLLCAKLILFGGVGFSGYNREYNADFGIYRQTIDRETEIQETALFDALYRKVSNALEGLPVIIVSHMPISDWHPSTSTSDFDHGHDAHVSSADHSSHCSADCDGTYAVYHPGFIYVSGHTHRNYFYDDGTIRVYADNQFGYQISHPSAWPHLKYFDVETARDYFADYADGIYEITVEDYIQFHRAKNIALDLTRQIHVIYMLKKRGIYCFIHMSEKGQLCIMNGGAFKKLNGTDIHYYYDNMERAISTFETPLDKYTLFQERVAEEVKRIGGLGTIHGCIIDIDFFSHIFISPDLSLTAYWALNIVDKIVYPSIPALLEENCPTLYGKFRRMISGKKRQSLPLLLQQTDTEPQSEPYLYLGTEIYKASRTIRKMQKLNDNSILAIWPERLPSVQLCGEVAMISAWLDK